MSKFVSFLLFVGLLFCMSFISCKKETETIIKTVVKTDTLVVTKHDTLRLTDFIHETATTFILVRHAEPLATGTNPGLSSIGQTRAEELKRILANVPLAAIFSSNYNRTKETAQPISVDKSLVINIYDPLSQTPLVDKCLKEYKGKTIFLVGHSNTIPDFLNLLVGTKTYPTLPETEYNNLYIATVTKKGQAKILSLKYGN